MKPEKKPDKGMEIKSVGAEKNRRKKIRHTFCDTYNVTQTIMFPMSVSFSSLINVNNDLPLKSCTAYHLGICKLIPKSGVSLLHEKVHLPSTTICVSLVDPILSNELRHSSLLHILAPILQSSKLNVILIVSQIASVWRYLP